MRASVIAASFFALPLFITVSNDVNANESDDLPEPSPSEVRLEVWARPGVGVPVGKLGERYDASFDIGGDLGIRLPMTSIALRFDYSPLVFDDEERDERGSLWMVGAVPQLRPIGYRFVDFSVGLNLSYFERSVLGSDEAVSGFALGPTAALMGRVPIDAGDNELLVGTHFQYAHLFDGLGDGVLSVGMVLGASFGL